MSLVTLAQQVQIVTGAFAIPTIPPVFSGGDEERLVQAADMFLGAIGIDQKKLSFQEIGTREKTLKAYPQLDEFPDPEAIFSEASVTAPHEKMTLLSYRLHSNGLQIPFALLFAETSGGHQLHKLLPVKPGTRVESENHLRYTNLWWDFNDLALPAFPTVYDPATWHVTVLLQTALPHLQHMKEKNPGMKTLVIGSGAGAEVAVLAKRLGISVDATDINPIAVANTLASAAYLGIDPSSVRAWVSDGFEAATDRYDAILLNAPWPQDDGVDSLSTRDPGGAFIKRILAGLREYLTPDGSLFLMSTPKIDNFLPKNPKTVTSRRLKLWTEWFVFGIHEIRLHRSWTESIRMLLRR
ncbi:MAG: hypothetical protein A2979_02765 [Deltaproteobacteria bacterium RIFCSPLOWO2_01_FULL_45_74]|nr:MAG: hypothetical protein A2712_07035 [Deltaproteobacteria bacterium RIFCSPHIGHO2_01_FULL_43_49]OGQ15702.1 MAG: hypothetical protein A3D22_05825 [Deltaproteobacteria bacterium RIFCSPHIGHO2_02_FULL_44_53]OGQ31993.1 MAG: hypothetical protein A2979_02765 [Deltaproteobacteria bacterium RIFCSPLOWO2_01_FULL_45_74]